MPFIRQTRDKRGFEQTLVMHSYQSGGQRPRVLYLFCSPANLRVGRTALDAEVMEALEHTHPDLSFDWGSIPRETVHARPEQERPRRPSREERPQARSSGTPPNQPPAPVFANDGSLLARVLGAQEASRIRQRQADVLQRVQRRARTPEERDRLTEQTRRLNPDEWADEAAIREQAAVVDSALNAVIAELPSRRRGRRGGRRRLEGERGASGIMVPGQPATPEDTPDEQFADAEVADSGGSDPGGDVDPDRPAATTADTASADAEAADPGPEIQSGD